MWSGFIEIAKLYDKTKDVVSVGLLLKYCRDNLDLFPEYRDIVTIKEDGREYSFQVPYQHHLKPTEECFYENEVKSQREILKLFDTPDFEKLVKKKSGSESFGKIRHGFGKNLKK